MIGGDDIPAGASPAQLIDRRENPGDIEGFIIARRYRRDQTQSFRHHRKCRDERKRFEPVLLGRAARQGVGVTNSSRSGIGEEHEIEFGSFRNSGHIQHVAEVGCCRYLACRVPPCGCMEAERVNKGSELDLVLPFRHRSLFCLIPILVSGYSRINAATIGRNLLRRLEILTRISGASAHQPERLRRHARITFPLEGLMMALHYKYS
ncbi:hypothetical protein D3C87_1535420 [compost metagenome]